MNIDIVSEKDVSKTDSRNTKKRFLPMDGICTSCGVITNIVYENRCVICGCGSNDLITGSISVQIRTLLNLEIYDLEALNELRGYSTGSRPKMVINILRSLNSLSSLENKRINEELVRKIILRNRKKFWFMRNIDDIIRKTKKQIKLNKPMNIKLVDIEDIIENKI